MSQIITIDDLNNYMNKSLTSTVAQQVVDAVNAYIENRTHRCWGEIKTATERVNWNSSLYLKHMDVVDITTAKTGYPGQTQDTVDADDYYVNPTGRLSFFTGGLPNPSRGYRDWLEIAYTYGVMEVPDDLKLAALGLVSRNPVGFTLCCSRRVCGCWSGRRGPSRGSRRRWRSRRMVRGWCSSG